ncbi:hypothetical protein ABID08_000441 [Rhizobium binae]|uniref:Uncharacterized protein n=1 Tax=Rhizobium binae TaxID=1138190 RepID=A0ABV2MCP1_9HYPH
MLKTQMVETNPINGMAAMLAKFQSMGRKSDKRVETVDPAQHFDRTVTAKVNLARFMHWPHGSHEQNPLPRHFRIAI